MCYMYSIITAVLFYLLLPLWQCKPEYNDFQNSLNLDNQSISQKDRKRIGMD